MFDLGHTRFVYYSPRDLDSMREVIADADVVVNLISKQYESHQPIQIDKFPYIGMQKNFSFKDVNVTIPSQIAQICTEMQVDNLIHVSSAAVSPDHPSEWAQTKYEGEQAVKENYPWATIIRPTQMFGTEDKFLHFFSNMGKMYRFVPLLDGGKKLTQPVWAVDVAKTISRIIDEPSKFEGRTVDCFGPSDYTYEELAKFCLDIAELDRPIVPLPEPVFMLLAKMLSKQSLVQMNEDVAKIWSQDFTPAMSAEEYKAQPDDADRILTMEDLGITPTPIEKEAFMYLHRFREAGHFGRVDGYH
jgi:NADH dehydrogenase (ubiquinone) 1 alpha subcomplex subunit 9